MNRGEPFQVSITSPDEVIWQGEAKSISSENSTGKFDVLPGHANFVTIIKPEAPIILRTTANEPVTFTYKAAVLAVKAGKTGIYVNI